MKYRLTDKQWSVIDRLGLPFDPHGDLDDSQCCEVSERLGDEVCMRGINDVGDGENAYGAFCADLLTEIARQEDAV